MKNFALTIATFCMAAGSHSQAARLIGPFNLGSGQWATVPFGGFDTNINGWGGMGANSLMYIAHGASPTNPNQLPYNPTTGVLRYGFHYDINLPYTSGAWLSGGVPQNVLGQRYVISAFVNLKGRQFYHPSETHVIAVDRGNYNYVRTANPLGGHDGWQFIYCTYTATGYLGGSFPIMIINEFRQSLAAQEVEFDEIAVTPEHLFAPPTVTGNGQTNVTGRVSLDGVVGPRPRSAFFEILQTPSGMRLATRQDLNPDGTFSFNVGNYGNATFRLRVKPDTGLWHESVGQFTLSGQGQGFPILNCTNGDIDNNNEVGPGDFSALIASFGLEEGQSGYNSSADLDGNQEVGPGDFTILSRNFGEIGD